MMINLDSYIKSVSDLPSGEGGNSKRVEASRTPCELLLSQGCGTCRKFLFQPFLHHGWNKAFHRSSMVNNFLHQTRADISERLSRHHENRFQVGFKFAIHQRHLEFVLIVRKGADAAQNGARLFLAGIIHQEPAESIHGDVGDLLGCSLQHVDALIDGEKRFLFTIDERIDMLQRATQEITNVSVDTFSGLLVDYARQKKARAILRGIRAFSDYEYELQMALMNRKLEPNLETVFMMPGESFAYISSRLVKEIVHHGGPVKGLVPPMVEERLKQKFPARAAPLR